MEKLQHLREAERRSLPLLFGGNMVIVVSLLVALIGVLMYFMSANPKLQEVGRIMFAFGLLAFLMGQWGPALELMRH